MRLLLALYLFLLCSCESPKDSLSLESRPDIFRANIFNDPPTLDPRKANDLTSTNIVMMLFEGFTRLNSEGEPILALAEHIDLSDDGLTYSITLRKSLWSDETELTVHDFLTAWQRTLSPNFPSNNAFHLYVIKNARKIKSGAASKDELGVKVIDDYHMEVNLEHPAPYFLELLASPSFYPMKGEADDGKITNGPYCLKSWQVGRELALERNPFYWDKNNVHIDQVLLVIVEDANTELYMYENNELEWAGAPFSHIPIDAIEELKEEGVLHSVTIAASYWFKINTSRPPFDNNKMRQAFSLALNRQAIIKYISQVDHQPATSLLPSFLQLQKEPYFQDGDVATARKLFNEALKEMGLTRETLPEIALSYNSSDDHQKIAQAIQQQWNRAFDINVTLENSEWKVHLDKMTRGDFQIARIAWVADYNDPMAFLEIFKYRNSPEYGGNNDTRWHDPHFAQLLKHADHEQNLDKRQFTLKQAEALFMQAMPLIPFYTITATYLKKDFIKGVFITPAGHIELKWGYICRSS